MVSGLESGNPALRGLGWSSQAVSIEEALDAAFPVYRPLEWLYLPPRAVNGLGLARAFPLEACPLALGRGRLVARDGRGRIYLVDSLSPSPLPLTANARRPHTGAGPALSRSAHREARFTAAYEGPRAGAALSALPAGQNGRCCGLDPEILASLYYLVVLCGGDAYSLVLDGGLASRGRGSDIDRIELAEPGFSGAGDAFLSSRCRIFRPGPRPAVFSSSSRRVPS